MIGILCGLRSEAKIADKIPNVLVGCSSARVEQAQILAIRMIEQGVTRLVSFGLAGATSPDLMAGDLILGATVSCADGAWEADPEWNARLMNASSHFLCAPVWASKRLVISLEEKEAIYRRTGGMLVDMESHIVAAAATQAGIPFNIVRAISDTADMSLPPAARVPLKKDGNVDFRGVFSSVVNQPSQLMELIRLGQNTFSAIRALKNAVAIIGEMGHEPKSCHEAV